MTLALGLAKRIRLEGVLVMLASASLARAEDPAKAAETKFTAEIAKATRANDLERAIAKAEECVSGLLRAPRCHLLAARAYTSRAGRRGGDATTDRATARKHFERFLEQADPADPEVPSVRKLLDGGTSRKRKGGR